MHPHLAVEGQDGRHRQQQRAGDGRACQEHRQAPSLAALGGAQRPMEERQHVVLEAIGDLLVCVPG